MFPEGPNVPSPGAWREFTANDIWLRVVTQVATVGGWGPVKAMMNDRPDLVRRLGYRRLCALPGRAAVRTSVWRVLRRAGVRYVARDETRCNKSNSLAKNLEVLRDHPGGPRGFVRAIASLQGPDLTRKRIEFVASRLHYVKNKGARDFLTTGLGLSRDSIAFDIRVLGSLRAIGIRIPKRVPADADAYAHFEQLLLKKLCRPLRLRGVDLDQLLFNHYAEIKKMRF